MNTSAVRTHESSIQPALNPNADRPVAGKSMRKATARLRYEKRKRHGRCTYGACTNEPAPSHTMCRTHLDRMSTCQKKRYLERRDKGLCLRCGLRARFWSSLCLVCRRDERCGLPRAAKRALRSYRNLERAAELQRKHDEARLAIARLMKSGQVTGKHAKALMLYAGMHDGVWRSGVEVARLMNLSKERVRQLLYPSKLILEEILGSNIPWKPVNVAHAKTSAEKSWKEPRWLRRPSSHEGSSQNK